ncbi:MAG: PEP-CTERM sorting domain-containing protein [Opitutales bacterium]|nr:PEP-CTERM sorting domain-containing protein [Opitutales bacterium]
MKRTLFYSLLALGATALASGQIITIANPWNSTDDTWTVTGSTDIAVSAGVDRWTGAGTWGNRGSGQDGDIGSNLGDNRRFRSEVDATPAGPAPGGSGNFLSFTITNNDTVAWTIDEFSFGVGRNVQTAAWLYSSIVIDNTETSLTADATSASSSVGAGGWDNPLVQFGPGTGANAWAQPVYSDIGLDLPAGDSAEFRIYLASGNSTTFFHLNDLNIELVPIPEPSTYAALFGLLAIGFVAWRRRRRA